MIGETSYNFKAEKKFRIIVKEGDSVLNLSVQCSTMPEFYDALDNLRKYKKDGIGVKLAILGLFHLRKITFMSDGKTVNYNEPTATIVPKQIKILEIKK